MKIDTTSGKVSALNNIGQPKSNSKIASNESTNKANADTVQISSQLSDTSPTFNSEKVAEIKAAIAEGRFTVNPHAVADSLISTVQDLIKSSTDAD